MSRYKVHTLFLLMKLLTVLLIPVPALFRKFFNPPDSSEQIDEENISVTVDQLFSALNELKPGLSADINTLGKYRFICCSLFCSYFPF
jgi:hypothetical protein